MRPIVHQKPPDTTGVRTALLCLILQDLLAGVSCCSKSRSVLLSNQQSCLLDHSLAITAAGVEPYAPCWP